MRRGFVQFTFVLLAVFFGVFTLEFLAEWNRLGRPGVEALSFSGVNGNAKLVDLLSPAARAYNNILSMLLATIGLAIPLTANMHTPKLIEMFLRDRLNQVIMIFGAFGAAHVIFVAYIIGPGFAPVWAIRAAVLGVLLGWAILVPYFFYIVRFVDPSNIILRLKHRVIETVERARRGRLRGDAAQDIVHEHLHNIGTIILKSLDRGDRGVALEGIWTLKQILDHYAPQKRVMPAAWFQVDRKDFVGLSAEALEFLNQDRTFFEMMVLTQCRLAYRQALSRSPDVVSSISDATRVIAVHAANAGDDAAMRLATRHFNNYLREAIRAKASHAIYDVFYQYRLLAKELHEHPSMTLEIARRIQFYADEARRNGLPFVPQLAAFDVGYIARRSFEAELPCADRLLDMALEMPHLVEGRIDFMVVKAKLQLGGFCVEKQLPAQADRVRGALADVPADVLANAVTDLLGAEASYFEISDRQLALEFVPVERREHLAAFVDGLAPPEARAATAG